MTESEPIDVIAAFEILLEEIEAELQEVSETGARAFAARNLPITQEALERASKITEFRRRVAALRGEWAALAHDAREPSPSSGRRAAAPPRTESRQPSRGKRRRYGILRPGVKTPEDEYRIPILQSLVERKGSARVSEVLKSVYAKLEHRLNDVDRQPLPSNPNTTRWENTAQWARNRMAREGLLKGDSPHGVWEISEEGRRVLQSYHRS